ncbi:uncharacterized protein EMH_0081820 [Eimeria mitis]|uniref:Uncharacterized protein n=1 Tax=Eimeria mitis TaxID=44415 RepID=U6K940_9EIME|nr:uncharacterized protein EMH_0081820 [Eimeria mitis]CDJ33326.1 hypothetical protein EMH_0081820 [Eimeria mitis]
MQRSQQTANPTFPSFPSSSSGIHEPQDLGQGAVHTTGLELADVGPEHLTTGLTIPELQPGNLPLDPLASYPQPLADASQPVLSEAQPFSRGPEDFPWSLLGAFANPESSDSPSQSTADPQPPVAAPQTISLKALLLQNSPQRSPRKRTYSEGPQQEPYPGLEPDSWLDNVPLIDSSPEEQRQSEAFSPSWASPDQAAPCSGAACQFSAGAASSGYVGQDYSTASAAGAGEAGAPAAAAAGPPAMATARPATDWMAKTERGIFA